MLNTPHTLENLGISPTEDQKVNIDGLVLGELPLDTIGDLRITISGVLAQSLFAQGVLNAQKGVTSENIVQIPFQESVLRGWRLKVLKEPEGVTICFLEGSGKIELASLSGTPIISVTQSSVDLTSNGCRFPIAEMFSVSSPDFYFRNPSYRG